MKKQYIVLFQNTNTVAPGSWAVATGNFDSKEPAAEFAGKQAQANKQYRYAVAEVCYFVEQAPPVPPSLVVTDLCK